MIRHVTAESSPRTTNSHALRRVDVALPRPVLRRAARDRRISAAFTLARHAAARVAGAIKFRVQMRSELYYLATDIETAYPDIWITEQLEKHGVDSVLIEFATGLVKRMVGVA